MNGLGSSAYALGGDDFVDGPGCGPLGGESLPDRGCCCCGCCAGAFAFAGPDDGALKGDGAVLCAVGDLLEFAATSAP